jgi:hypothetical protein
MKTYIIGGTLEPRTLLHPAPLQFLFPLVAGMGFGLTGGAHCNRLCPQTENFFRPKTLISTTHFSKKSNLSFLMTAPQKSTRGGAPKLPDASLNPNSPPRAFPRSSSKPAPPRSPRHRSSARPSAPATTPSPKPSAGCSTPRAILSASRPPPISSTAPLAFRPLPPAST